MARTTLKQYGAAAMCCASRTRTRLKSSSNRFCRSLAPEDKERRRRAAEQRDELAPLHRADPKPKDHGEYSRSGPCIAAKAARSCPLWVLAVSKLQHSPQT